MAEEGQQTQGSTGDTGQGGGVEAHPPVPPPPTFQTTQHNEMRRREMSRNTLVTWLSREHKRKASKFGHNKYGLPINELPPQVLARRRAASKAARRARRAAR